MTEHAAVVFVFFFLAEYGSIVLMCILTSILFLGGYLLINNLDTINLILLDLLNFYSYIDYVLLSDNNFIYFFSYFSFFKNNSIIEGFLYGFNLGLKSSILIFVFIWTRASFPRIRFDQLMTFCWTVLLPVLFSLIILIPCVLYCYNIFPINIYLL